MREPLPGVDIPPKENILGILENNIQGGIAFSKRDKETQCPALLIEVQRRHLSPRRAAAPSAG